MPEHPSPIASRRITPTGLPRAVGEQPVQHNRVVAVYGTRTGVGVTSVAAGLTLACRSIVGGDVAFAELDPRVMRAREQATRSSIVAQRTPANGVPVFRDDRLHFLIEGTDAAMVRDADGVWRLAVTRPRAPAVGDAKAVTVALDAMRSRFAVTVAELEHQVSERTLAAFDTADRIAVVTEGTVPSLRGTQRVLRLCRRLNYPDEKMCLVVNRFDAPGALQLTDIAAVLKREIYWRIGDVELADMAGLAHKLMSD